MGGARSQGDDHVSEPHLGPSSAATEDRLELWMGDTIVASSASAPLSFMYSRHPRESGKVGGAFESRSG